MAGSKRSPVVHIKIAGMVNGSVNYPLTLMIMGFDTHPLHNGGSPVVSQVLGDNDIPSSAWFDRLLEDNVFLQVTGYKLAAQRCGPLGVSNFNGQWMQ